MMYSDVLLSVEMFSIENSFCKKTRCVYTSLGPAA